MLNESRIALEVARRDVVPYIAAIVFSQDCDEPDDVSSALNYARLAITGSHPFWIKAMALLLSAYPSPVAFSNAEASIKLGLAQVTAGGKRRLSRSS